MLLRPIPASVGLKSVISANLWRNLQAILSGKTPGGQSLDASGFIQVTGPQYPVFLAGTYDGLWQNTEDGMAVYQGFGTFLASGEVQDQAKNGVSPGIDWIRWNAAVQSVNNSKCAPELAAELIAGYTSAGQVEDRARNLHRYIMAWLASNTDWRPGLTIKNAAGVSVPQLSVCPGGTFVEQKPVTTVGAQGPLGTRAEYLVKEPEPGSQWQGLFVRYWDLALVHGTTDQVQYTLREDWSRWTGTIDPNTVAIDPVKGNVVAVRAGTDVPGRLLVGRDMEQYVQTTVPEVKNTISDITDKALNPPFVPGSENFGPRGPTLNDPISVGNVKPKGDEAGGGVVDDFQGIDDPGTAHTTDAAPATAKKDDDTWFVLLLLAGAILGFVL